MNSQASVRAGLVWLALLTAGCAAAPRQKPIELGDVNTGAGSLAAARRYLQGRWSLISYDVFPPGRAPIQLKGKGTLSYDEYGNLDMEIRVDPATAKLLDGAGIQSDQGVISTKGRTAVDMQARTLTYILEGQPPLGAPSGPLAPNRPRHWEVAGNVLTLTTNGDDGKPASVGRWQKAP
jgi:hypothetical protein